MISKQIRFEQEPSQDQIKEFLKTHSHTQLFSQNCFHGPTHIKHALLETQRAFEEHRNISKTEEIEFLLRLAGERQIKKTIESCKTTQKSIFVSWHDNAQQVLNDLTHEFKLTTTPTKTKSPREELDAIEKTATFWI